MQRLYPYDEIRVALLEALESITEAARLAARYTRGDCTRRKIAAAATLFYEVIARHPLTDGNKRLVTLLLDAFLAENGLRQPPTIYEAAVRVARGEWSLGDVIEWLRCIQLA